jgi:hypothetical protein
VTFYGCGPNVSLPHLEGAYLPLALPAIVAREEHAPRVLESIGRVMFSERWAVHSFRAFYERIISLARQLASR